MAAKQKKPWHGTGRKARSHFFEAGGHALQAKRFSTEKGDSMTRKQFTLSLAAAAVLAVFGPAQAQNVNVDPNVGVDGNVGISNTDVNLGANVSPGVNVGSGDQTVNSSVSASQQSTDVN